MTPTVDDLRCAFVLHDIRNLLQVAMILAEDAAEDGADVAELGEVLERMRATLTLELQRRMSTNGSASQQDVEDMLRMARRIASRARITFHPSPEPLRFRIPQVDLERCLLNTLLNAANASAPGGAIDVRVQEVDGDRARILVCNTLSAGSEGRSGTGLGLLSVRKLVGDAGGTFALERVEGGVQAVLTLPASRSEDDLPDWPPPA